MKWISHVVVLSVLAFSFEIAYRQEALAAAAASEAGCIQRKAASCSVAEHNDSHNEKKNTCDPMQVCSGCIGCATAPNGRFSFQIFRQSTDERVAFENVILAEYEAPFWHPPQAV